ncbi:MAG: glycogen synthase GlgA [Kiritimatiellaeota bacterium]|nr:glycogen synthase GlgA [Kiritimatiellota bacterium]
MKIVYVASEINPYASTGGLADVAGALPRALAKFPGAEVLRIMPLYRMVAERGFALQDTGLRLDIPVGFRTLPAEIWRADEESPRTYFVRRDEFFDRSHLYGSPDKDYDDNFERFVFFQKAVVALIDALKLQPDIVNCNDWQTGLLPLFLRQGIRGMGREQREHAVFTIHNLAFQGIFNGAQYGITNLPFLYFNMDGLEFYGNISSMKAGIAYAERVTTVSRTYAQEIQTDAFGCGLQGLLSRLSGKLIGIQNGVDYADWDPATDRQIAAPFSAAKLEGKEVCRQSLARQLGLTLKPGRPLLGMVTRLTDQKGLDLLSRAMPELMQRDVTLVLLGLGQEKYHDLCRQWAQTWPDRFAAKLDFDTSLARRIIAGSDIMLMPSRFEPCGLNHLYGLRYGTIPLVHAVGGLDDTVAPVANQAQPGNGFKFKAYAPAALLSAVDEALGCYRDPAAWRRVMTRNMALDFSWSKQAVGYMEMYRQIVEASAASTKLS